MWAVSLSSLVLGPHTRFLMGVWGCDTEILLFWTEMDSLTWLQWMLTAMSVWFSFLSFFTSFISFPPSPGCFPNILCHFVLWFAFIVLYKFTFSLDLEASQDLSLAVFHHCCKQMLLYAILYHIIMLLSTRSSFLRLFVMNLLYSRLQ